MILGVDIGLRGALARLDADGGLVNIHDMPCLDSGHVGRREICPARLVSLIRSSGASLAYVETVASRPESTPKAVFSFGRSKGVIEGVLAACGIATGWLTPGEWHRIVGLQTGSSKDDSIAEALRRWPGRADLLTRHDRAEAALIALAGLLRARAREAA